MFYNHAEETAKRKLQATSLAEKDTLSMEGKQSGVTGPSNSVASSLNGGENLVSGGKNGGVHNGEQSFSRPAWPPSHAEIVADAHNEGLVHMGEVGPSIPMWYRGPLLLAGKLDLPSARGARSMRSGFSSVGSGRSRGVRDPVGRPDRSGIRGLSSWISASSIASTPTASEQYAEDEREGTDGGGEGEGEGGRVYGRVRYTEREKAVIRKVMSQLEDGCLGKPFPGYENLTHEEWLQWICTPVIRELQIMDGHGASRGMDLRQRFSAEAGLEPLRRWVLRHAPIREGTLDRRGRAPRRYNSAHYGVDERPDLRRKSTGGRSFSARDTWSDRFDSNDSRRSRSLPPESGVESYGRSNSSSSFSSSSLSTGTSESSRPSETSRDSSRMEGAGGGSSARLGRARRGDANSDTDDFRQDSRLVRALGEEGIGAGGVHAGDETGDGRRSPGGDRDENNASVSPSVTSSSTFDDRLSNRSWTSEHTWMTGSALSGYPSDGEGSSMISSPGRGIGGGRRPRSVSLKQRVPTPQRVARGKSSRRGAPTSGTPRFQVRTNSWLSSGGGLSKSCSPTPPAVELAPTVPSEQQAQTAERRSTLVALSNMRPGANLLDAGAKLLSIKLMASFSDATTSGYGQSGSVGRSNSVGKGDGELSRRGTQSAPPTEVSAGSPTGVGSPLKAAEERRFAGLGQGMTSMEQAKPEDEDGRTLLLRVMSASSLTHAQAPGQARDLLSTAADAAPGIPEDLESAAASGQGTAASDDPGRRSLSMRFPSFTKKTLTGPEQQMLSSSMGVDDSGSGPNGGPLGSARRLSSQSSWRWKSPRGLGSSGDFGGMGSKKIGPRPYGSGSQSDDAGGRLDLNASGSDAGNTDVEQQGRLSRKDGGDGGELGGGGADRNRDEDEEDRAGDLGETDPAEDLSHGRRIAKAFAKVPSRLDRLLFFLWEPTNRYRHLHLALWIAVMAVMVVDRLLWNAWPRQEMNFCSPDCGRDFMCPDEQAWCLMDGPWSVKAFDVLARVTGRIIISTTSLIMVTMCNGTWIYLSETKRFRKFLRSWRDDNARIRSIGVCTLVVALLAHVYALFLPSVFNGYRNHILEPTGISWPAEILPAEPFDRIDIGERHAYWAPDDVLSASLLSVVVLSSALITLVVWMRLDERLAFLHEKGILFERGLAVFGLFFLVETFRRGHHPHVWLLNGPSVIWFVGDIIYCRLGRRVEKAISVTRIPLGANHEMLLWKKKRASGSTSLSSSPSSVVSRGIGNMCRLRHRQGPVIGRNGNPSAMVLMFSPRCLAAHDVKQLTGGARSKAARSAASSYGEGEPEANQGSFMGADFREYYAKAESVLGASNQDTAGLDMSESSSKFGGKSSATDAESQSVRHSGSHRSGRKKRQMLTRRSAEERVGTDSSAAGRTGTLSHDMTPTSKTATTFSDVFDDRLTAPGSSAADGDDDFSDMPSFEDSDFSSSNNNSERLDTRAAGFMVGGGGGGVHASNGDNSSHSSTDGMRPIPGGYPVPEGKALSGASNVVAASSGDMAPGLTGERIAPVPEGMASSVIPDLLLATTFPGGDREYVNPGVSTLPPTEFHDGDGDDDHGEIKVEMSPRHVDDDIDGTDEEQVDVGVEDDHVFETPPRGGRSRPSLSMQLNPGFAQAFDPLGVTAALASSTRESAPGKDDGGSLIGSSFGIVNVGDRPMSMADAFHSEPSRWSTAKSVQPAGGLGFVPPTPSSPSHMRDSLRQRLLLLKSAHAGSTTPPEAELKPWERKLTRVAQGRVDVEGGGLSGNAEDDVEAFSADLQTISVEGSLQDEGVAESKNGGQAHAPGKADGQAADYGAFIDPGFDFGRRLSDRITGSPIYYKEEPLDDDFESSVFGELKGEQLLRTDSSSKPQGRGARGAERGFRGRGKSVGGIEDSDDDADAVGNRGAPKSSTMAQSLDDFARGGGVGGIQPFPGFGMEERRPSRHGNPFVAHGAPDSDSDLSGDGKPSAIVAAAAPDLERFRYMRSQRRSDEASSKHKGRSRKRTGSSIRDSSKSERGSLLDQDGRHMAGARSKTTGHFRSRSSQGMSLSPRTMALTGAAAWAQLGLRGRMLRVEAPAGEDRVLVSMDDGGPARSAPPSSVRTKTHSSRAAVASTDSSPPATGVTVADMTLAEFFAGLDNHRRMRERDTSSGGHMSGGMTAAGVLAPRTPSEYSWALGSPTSGFQSDGKGSRRQGRRASPGARDIEEGPGGDLLSLSPFGGVFAAATGPPPGATGRLVSGERGARGGSGGAVAMEPDGWGEGAGGGVQGWDCMAIISVGEPGHGGFRRHIGGAGGDGRGGGGRAGAKGGGGGGGKGGRFGFGKKGVGKDDEFYKGGGARVYDAREGRVGRLRKWRWKPSFMRGGLGRDRATRNANNDSIAMTSMTATEANSSIAETRRNVSRVGGLTRASSCSMSAIDNEEGTSSHGGRTTLHNNAGGVNNVMIQTVTGYRTVGGGGVRGTSIVDAHGPYESPMGRLAGFPNVPPLLVIATGTGAGVVLDFAAHVAAQGIEVPVEGRNVTICYGSDSEPLLRLVTHALLAKKTPAIRVRTALCTLDGQDGQGFAYRYEDLVLETLDMDTLVAEASPDTEVFFCGEMRVGREIQAVCTRACLKYSGTYTE